MEATGLSRECRWPDECEARQTRPLKTSLCRCLAEELQNAANHASLQSRVRPVALHWQAEGARPEQQQALAPVSLHRC